MSRAGLAKTEILVIGAIVAITLALLIPFVLHQRTASRSLTCQDRLQRLATAVQMHDSQTGWLPGYRNFFAEERSTGWVALLLPHLTTPDVNGPQHLQDAYAALVADKVGPTRLPELLCPAQDRFNGDAPLSFVANCGLPDNNADAELPPDWPANGLFFNRALAGPQQVSMSLAWLTERDGARATLLLAENIDAKSWRDADEAAVGFVWAANMQGGAPSSLPTVWPINQQRGAGDGSIKFARPASEHPGGANVVHASGSSQLLSEEIDYLVFQRRMTADGAQVKAAGRDEPLPEPWRHRP